MDRNERKLEEITGYLRRSRPALKHADILTDRIMRELKYAKKQAGFPSGLWDSLFGWVYIGWVRRSLVALSVAILLLFVYQQSVIISRINAIDRQIVTSGYGGGRMVSGKADARDLFRRIEGVFPVNSKKLNEKEVDELIESINSLQVKYKDILRIIDEDPDLKKYLEKKLNEKNVK